MRVRRDFTSTGSSIDTELLSSSLTSSRYTAVCEVGRILYVEGFIFRYIIFSLTDTTINVKGM